MRSYCALASLLVVGVAALSACTDTEIEQSSAAKLREVTLQAIDVTDPALIVISDVNRTPAKVSWRATVGAKTYVCDADTFYRLPWCRPEA